MTMKQRGRSFLLALRSPFFFLHPPPPPLKDSPGSWCDGSMSGVPGAAGALPHVSWVGPPTARLPLPTVPLQLLDTSNIRLHHMWVQRKPRRSPYPARTLPQILQMLGHEGRTIDMLKVCVASAIRCGRPQRSHTHYFAVRQSYHSLPVGPNGPKEQAGV